MSSAPACCLNAGLLPRCRIAASLDKTKSYETAKVYDYKHLARRHPYLIKAIARGQSQNAAVPQKLACGADNGVVLTFAALGFGQGAPKYSHPGGAGGGRRAELMMDNITHRYADTRRLAAPSNNNMSMHGRGRCESTQAAA